LFAEAGRKELALLNECGLLCNEIGPLGGFCSPLTCEESFMSDKRTLIVPPGASRDPAAMELVRIWVSREAPYFAIAGSQWDDPAVWGLLLADLARHVANVYQRDTGANTDATVDRIKSGFLAELSSAQET
jgi:hypothetical protein